MSPRAMREEAFGGGTSGQNKSANPKARLKLRIIIRYDVIFAVLWIRGVVE